ncbi:hypothetical protein GQ600_20795 [Phytophthora cactorum]|nr:hypothetical protein GQ600_20795 [Phytophthora cactorum]
MPATESQPAPAPLRTRAPPPPVPNFPPEPTPEAAPEKAPRPAIEPVRAGAAAEPPTKHKARGLMRAIGGLFKRKASDADDAMAPSDTPHVALVALVSLAPRVAARSAARGGGGGGPETAPIQENESAASSPYMEEPPAKKAKKVKAEHPKTEKKATPCPLRSNSHPPIHRSCWPPTRPELRPSELDDLHENDIRPSLQAKMPLFFSPPLVENMRRSSILPDPKEYEF